MSTRSLPERLATFTPHPRFDDAVAAMDGGDVERLRQLLDADPQLVHARTNLEPPYHYFTGATLLHHMAGNPTRGTPDGHGTLPPNSVEVVKLLLERGADVNATTLGPNGGSTIGLLITSKQANDTGLSGPLMDVLLAHGATLDLKQPDALDPPLANHAPRAAERMIELGAKPDLLAAAALGRLDLLRSFFTATGTLKSRPVRNGKEMTEPDAIGLALLYAYVRQQTGAVDFLLEKNGNWNAIGVNNGTALHRAAWEGDLPMVQRLVARGADISNRNNPFTATPLSWADHNKQAEVFRWMRAHCAIDLHDAVCFDLPEHVEARLRENAASVNERRDQWDVPQGTPLYWATRRGREPFVTLLLQNGADPNIVCGNGMTALDAAYARGVVNTIALLERHGAKKAADL